MYFSRLCVFLSLKVVLRLFTPGIACMAGWLMFVYFSTCMAVSISLGQLFLVISVSSFFLIYFFPFHFYSYYSFSPFFIFYSYSSYSFSFSCFLLIFLFLLCSYLYFHIPLGNLSEGRLVALLVIGKIESYYNAKNYVP